MKAHKEYIGDSVYVQTDGYHIILTTENGLPDDPRNRIALEPQVLEALNEYVDNLSKKQRMTECWDCVHKREVPGNCHIRCDKPDRLMIGDPWGIQNGWFDYPLLFDPVWKTKECRNFEAK